MAERKEEYFQARDIYLVEISVIRAINLAKADTFGKSDGFVKVECLNRKFRTITIKSDLDPTWDAHTQFQFFRKPMQVKFRVLDWNAPPQKDTPIGHYILDISDDYWLKGNCGFKKQIVDLVSVKRGQIEIALSCSKLEPFSYLDRMRKCAEQKIQYKQDLQTCQQNYKNNQKEYDQIQQACAAYEQKCTQLQDECTNYAQQKNTYEEQGRKCDREVKTLKEECSTADSRYNNLVKEYKDVEYECDQYIKEYSKTKKQCEELQNAKQQLQQQYEQQLQQQQYQQQQQQQEDTYQQQDNTYDTKEPINEYDDNTYDDDDDDNNYKKKIKEYILNVGKQDDECDIYDNELCTQIITKYKEQYDIYVSGITEDNDEDNAEDNDEYISARDKSNKYLIEIQKWSHGCNEEIYRKMQRCLGEDDLNYTDTNQKQFFNDFYVQLNKFFFCLQIIDATLQIFEDDIKKSTKRNKISAVTFNDLAGNTDATGDTKNDSEEDEEPTTVWRTLYEDLDFVIDELGNIFTPYMRKKPLQQMCKLNSDFITSCYDGNYTLFSKLLSHYICRYIVEEILDEDDNPNNLLDDGINGTILVLNDKKAFVNKLFRSMEDNKQIPKENDNDNDTGGYDEDEQDTYGDDDDIQDKYEQIIALIIALVCQLDCLGGETKLDKKDKDMIKQKLDIALSKCGEFNVDDKSVKLIQQFFGYFFTPESSGGVCCSGGDDGSESWFGSLFGSLCK